MFKNEQIGLLLLYARLWEKTFPYLIQCWTLSISWVCATFQLPRSGTREQKTSKAHFLEEVWLEAQNSWKQEEEIIWKVGFPEDTGLEGETNSDALTQDKLIVNWKKNHDLISDKITFLSVKARRQDS